jgi:hypothetical protein
MVLNLRTGAKKNGYNLNKWDASKEDLENTDVDKAINNLGDHELDNYKVIYLYPWYTLTLKTLERLFGPPRHRVLLKISTNEAFECGFYDLKLIKKHKIHVTGYTMKPKEPIETCLIRRNIPKLIESQCMDEIFKKINP